MTVAVITGANRGIGLEFARQLNKLGYTVYGTARDTSKAEELRKVASVISLDVADEDSIKQLAKQINQPIDLLINNSGLLCKDNLPEISQKSLVEQFKVNSCGPILVSQALLPLLESGESKIVNITSRMGSIEDNTSGGRYGYRASKTALNMMTKSFAIDKPNITTFMMHPGFIKTEMTGGNGDMGPEEAVEKMIKVIMTSTKESAGKFFHRDGQELPW